MTRVKVVCKESKVSVVRAVQMVLQVRLVQLDLLVRMVLQVLLVTWVLLGPLVEQAQLVREVLQEAVVPLVSLVRSGHRAMLDSRALGVMLVLREEEEQWVPVVLPESMDKKVQRVRAVQVAQQEHVELLVHVEEWELQGHQVFKVL